MSAVEPNLTIRKFEIVSDYTYTLRIFNCEGEAIEFGLANPRSNVLTAKFKGKCYVGYLHMNPGSYDENGVCISRHTTGVTLASLLTIFSSPDEKRPWFPTQPLESWNAWFVSRPPAVGLSIRVFFSSPFAKAPLHSFQEDLEMHELLL
jgi:hypothetical protein